MPFYLKSSLKVFWCAPDGIVGEHVGHHSPPRKCDILPTIYPYILPDDSTLGFSRCIRRQQNGEKHPEPKSIHLRPLYLNDTTMPFLMRA